MPTRIRRVAPNMISSSNTMPALGHPMPVDWTLIGLTLEGAREPEHAALGVHPAGAGVEERLGDVLGPKGIARTQDVGGVVAGLGAQMDRHGPSVFGRHYFRNLLVVLSASTLPPVWHVAQ